MRALPSLLAFLAALALHLNVYGAQAAEDASRVGVVDKVENEAQVISASGAVTASRRARASEGRAAHGRQCAASSYVPRRNSAYSRRTCERRDRPLCLRSGSRHRRDRAASD